MPIRVIKHEAVPQTGSFEVRLPDGRPSIYFYWDDIPARRLSPQLTLARFRRAAGSSFASASAPKCLWERLTIMTSKRREERRTGREERLTSGRTEGWIMASTPPRQRTCKPD